MLLRFKTTALPPQLLLLCPQVIFSRNIYGCNLECRGVQIHRDGQTEALDRHVLIMQLTGALMEQQELVMIVFRVKDLHQRVTGHLVQLTITQKTIVVYVENLGLPQPLLRLHSSTHFHTRAACRPLRRICLSPSCNTLCYTVGGTITQVPRCWTWKRTTQT